MQAVRTLLPQYVHTRNARDVRSASQGRKTHTTTKLFVPFSILFSRADGAALASHVGSRIVCGTFLLSLSSKGHQAEQQVMSTFHARSPV